MASIRKETVIAANPDAVWTALRDWGALHERLAPGFVVDVRLDGRDRLVTFFDGSVVREQLVDCDEERRRLVWSIVDGPYSHHNGSAQVVPDGEDRALFVWTTDMLPDALAEQTAQLMEHGMRVIKATLQASSATPVHRC